MNVNWHFEILRQQSGRPFRYRRAVQVGQHPLDGTLFYIWNWTQRRWESRA